MRKHWIAALLAMATLALPAASASAAIEVGNDCIASAGSVNSAMAPVARTIPSPLPLTAPSAGVVTSWKVRSAVPVAFVERLKVFRPTSNPNRLMTVGQSAPAKAVQGTNVFSTRVAVQAGDSFGAFGGDPGGAVLYCEAGPGNDSLALNNDPGVGSSFDFSPSIGSLPAISVLLEPDADGDGFGDETQDKCLRSSKVQGECPLIALSSSGRAFRRSARIRVTSSSSAPVMVSATVRVPGRPRNGRRAKPRTLKLSAPMQTVAAGQEGRFVLSFPASLKSAVRALTPRRALKLKVTASATDAAGQLSVSALTLRLKGRAKTR